MDESMFHRNVSRALQDEQLRKNFKFVRIDLYLFDLNVINLALY